MNTYILDIKRSKAYGKVLRKRFFDGYNGERVVTIYNGGSVSVTTIILFHVTTQVKYQQST